MSRKQTLLDRYRDAASRHGVATHAGESDQANVAHDELKDVARQLRESGDLSQLEELLVDDESGVRLWAASHLLDEAPAVARPVLEDLVHNDRSIVGFVAQTTLREWQRRHLSAKRDVP